MKPDCVTWENDLKWWKLFLHKEDRNSPTQVHSAVASWNSSLFCATPFSDSYLGLFSKKNLQLVGSELLLSVKWKPSGYSIAFFQKLLLKAETLEHRDLPESATGNAGIQSLPSVCTSGQLLPFCYDSSYAVIAAIAAHAIRRSFSQRIHEAKSICHASASPPAFTRTSLKQCSTVLGLAGRAQLDTNCFPSYRVELPCHAALCDHMLRDWHLQNYLLFSIKASLGWF